MKELSAGLYRIQCCSSGKVEAYYSFTLLSNYLKIQKRYFPDDSEETILRRFCEGYLEQLFGFLVHDKTVEFISNLAYILTNYTYIT